MMGGDLPVIFQAWISAGLSMIVMPLLILTLMFLFSCVLWWLLRTSLSFHVSWRKYPLCLLRIIILTILSCLLSSERPYKLWLSIVNVYKHISTGLVVVHDPCPGKRKSSSGVVNFHVGKWWFSGGRFQVSSCLTMIDLSIGSVSFQVAGLSTCVRVLTWLLRGQS